MKSFIDNKNQPSQFVKPLKKSKKKKKAVWEGSKADKEMDKKQGFKEGSKQDNAIDKREQAKLKKKKTGKQMLGRAMKKIKFCK